MKRLFKRIFYSESKKYFKNLTKIISKEFNSKNFISKKSNQILFQKYLNQKFYFNIVVIHSNYNKKLKT